MRLTVADAEADDTLPAWMADARFPDWSRDTKYRSITELDYCVALIEVRRGFRDQQSFDKLIASRASEDKRRAKGKAASDALSPVAKAAKDLRKKQQQRLARLTSVVKMRERMLSESIAKYGEQSGLFLDGAQLQWAREALDSHVVEAIAEEFRLRAL